VLHILAKALHVRGQPPRMRYSQRKYFQASKTATGGQERGPDDRRDRQLRQMRRRNFRSEWRTAAEEVRTEKKRREQQSTIVQAPPQERARAHVRMDEGPELSSRSRRGRRVQLDCARR